MLDTLMVLVLLGALAALGCLMGFFGGRYFRPFSFLIGFCGGALLVIFLLGRLASNMSLTSMPAIIAAGGVGLLLGALSVVFRFVGLAITGIAAGLAAGTGIVFCADFLLGGLIPPIVYTFICVLIASIIALSCLVRPGAGRVFSTSILGGFAVVSAIAMVVAWFASQRGELAQLLASSESLITDAGIIYAAMSDQTLALYVVSCLLLGVAMFALQSPYIEQTEIEPGIDELEDEPFEQAKEAAPVKERRKKREPKEKRQKKKRQKRRFSGDEDFGEDYTDYDAEGDDYEYDEDYAELDAMIEQGMESADVLDTEEQPQEGGGQTDDDALEETGEIAFSEGKKTLTADGREQPAHGPLRPKSLPDKNGFVEKAVAVHIDDVEEPTMVFQPILEEDEPQEGAPVEEPLRKPAVDRFSTRKPTFKREKTLSDEMDYKPQGSFAPRTARKKKR